MRRSAEEVARDKAELAAKRRAVLKKKDDDLRKLSELERDLDAQEKENATQAARPPPEQPVVEKAVSAPLTSRSSSRPRPGSKANGRAAMDDDNLDVTPVGQRVQPGRAKRLRREDLEAYRKCESNAAPPGGDAPDGVSQEPVVVEGGSAPKDRVVGGGRSKKRKSEAGNEDE